MLWILLVLFYGLAKGVREIFKKKALERNTVIEVLIVYTFVSFLLVVPTAGNAGGLPLKMLAVVAVKSFVIFIAWLASFKAIEKMPISLIGVLDLSRVLFSTLLGVVILGENMTLPKIIGLIFVLAGLMMLKFKPGSKKSADKQHGKSESVALIYILLTLLSCILNAVSGTMDKVLMKSMTSTQLQFWYMLFLVLYYLIYILIKRVKLNFKTLIKNYWIIALSVLFVLADKALFIANGIAESEVTVMTLIKQSGCIMTILGGKFVFHEKNIGYKLLCASVVIAGILISVAF
ncbi:MAG: EamA family transporter [Lachnospiraceae bacterium]|nr:EamA family transporter [Lachnospiraceae bacterium]